MLCSTMDFWQLLLYNVRLGQEVVSYIMNPAAMLQQFRWRIEIIGTMSSTKQDQAAMLALL